MKETPHQLMLPEPAYTLIVSFDERRVSMLPGALLVLLLWTSASGTTTAPRVAAPAPPGTAEALAAVVEQARLRFVAKDAAGVYSLYDELRARVRVNHVEMVDGQVWFYTTGEVTGHLPLVGWVTVLSWQREPEVARRQGEGWRLVGFQD